MENNDLKEKIRKNIKEEIAISNIRKEFGMKIGKNKKLIYTISSICAVFILGVGIFVGTNKLNNNIFQNDTLEIGKTEEIQNKDESLNIELNINKLDDMAMASFDADIKTIEMKKLPEKYNFIKNISIPNEYKLTDCYNVYIKDSQDSEKYDVLHDYVFYYEKDSINKIRISFSEKGEPLRDYFIDNDKENISRIGELELIISQWKEMYIVTFEYEDIYFDIETTGITENQLVDLLESLINNVKNVNKVMEEKDININEEPTQITTTNYPTYYSGKYIDNNGNNVILLYEDSPENRKQICNILGITESKTIFKKAEYTYEYLIKLQNKISEKMQNKELPFVTSSSLMEDKNNIKVTVTSNSISDWNKIKELDTIGGALDIQYETNNIGTEELVTTE